MCVVTKKKQIVEFLKKISAGVNSKYDCFACYISSHGLENHVSCQDDDCNTDQGRINIQDMIRLFLNDACKGLAGKPKLFFSMFAWERKQLKVWLILFEAYFLNKREQKYKALFSLKDTAQYFSNKIVVHCSECKVFKTNQTSTQWAKLLSELWKQLLGSREIWCGTGVNEKYINLSLNINMYKKINYRAKYDLQSGSLPNTEDQDTKSPTWHL